MNRVSAERYTLPLYKRESLRFECTGCGACCSTRGDYHVFLSDEEAEKIRIFLGLSRSWFHRHYLARLPEEGLVIRSNTDEKCIFLSDDGQCRVYPVRPVQCSTYPFWPELVKTAKAWRHEARRCEGMGRGAEIPLKKIEAALKKQGGGF